MCIMEVRAGARASTIAQACAHNSSTVERDVDMFAKLLDGRGEHEKAANLRQAQGHLKRAYADLLELFGEFVSQEEVSIPALRDAADAPSIGNERVYIDQANRDAKSARRYETR